MRAAIIFSSFACATLFSPALGVATGKNYTSTCHTIAKSISSASEVFYPGSSTYSSDIFHALGTSSQNSSCTVQPGTSEDISIILKAIGASKTPYAVKSGGHAINPGWSSTPGVLISMSRFNSTSYDTSTKLAKVGTGQKWETVYAALAKHGVSVAGARIADVGVGGFTLGGGYSWLANQLGLSCDTVLEYELVLPTGKIVTVNKDTYPDLLFGLKGGGNQFGVVTSFKMITHPQSDVYGGRIVVNKEQLTKANEIVANFDATNKDPKAEIGITYGFDPTLNGTFISFFLYYDAPQPPNGTFNDILALPRLSGAPSTTTLSDLVGSLKNISAASFAPRGRWRSISIRKYTVPFLENVVQQLDKYGPQVFNRSGTAFSFAVEPLLAAAFSHKTGPTAYIHNPQNFFGPSTVLSTWQDPSQDSWFLSMLKSFDEEVVNFADSKAGGSQNVGLPEGILYSNYASSDQPSSAFFGSNIPSLRKIQNKYDPHGVTKLTTGFRFVN